MSTPVFSCCGLVAPHCIRLSAQFFIGTSAGNLFNCAFSNFAPELAMTCHNNSITDITFPV